MNERSNTTPHIVLTALQEQDAPIVHGWREDPTFRDGTLSYPFPTSLEATREWIRSFAPRATPTEICFAARLEAESPLMGYAQLRGIDWIARCAEIGLAVGDRAQRGQGYGHAILHAMIDYAHDVLALRRLWLRVAATNTAAIALYVSAGFQHEGTLRRHAFRAGQFVDVMVFGLERGAP